MSDLYQAECHSRAHDDPKWEEMFAGTFGIERCMRLHPEWVQLKLVESAGSLQVYTPRQSIDDTHVTEIRTRRRLLPGRYVIVPEADDE